MRLSVVQNRRNSAGKLVKTVTFARHFIRVVADQRTSRLTKMTDKPPQDIITEHAALIGRVAIAWNDLNYVLIHLFGQFSGMPRDKAIAVYFTPKSDRMQRDLIKAVAEIALKDHPEIWKALKKSLYRINTFAGERNAAIHTSWAVTFPEPKFVPAVWIPTHGALKPDFVAQFEQLKENLSKEFIALNEVRTAFEKVQRRQAARKTAP